MKIACGITIVAAVTTLAACSTPPSPAPSAGGETVRLAEDVTVRRVAPGLWVHTTLGGGYPANGMLLETAGGSVLFDTGWNERQTEALLEWAARDLHHPVTAAVITHDHVDRIGGIAALRRAGVRVEALGLTAALARAQGIAPPDPVPGLGAAPRADPAGFELYYPGPGHAPDNIVAWFPRQRVLFGGCLVKADTATTVGNVADADVREWPASVARVRARYPRARLVVPGHGALGGVSALRATEALIAAKGEAAVRALRANGGG